MPQIPDMTSLLNAFMLPPQQQEQPPIRVPAVSPAIMDSAMFNPPQGDPYVALTAMLNNLSNQPLAQAPKMSTLDIVMDSIARAAAVGASQSPGETLTGFIKEKGQRRQENVEAERQRQNLINTAKIQAGFQQATDLAKEQARAREQGRGFTYEMKAGEVGEAREIRKEARAYKRTIDLKEADLRFAERERENALFFENKNEAMINILRKNKILLDMLPQQNQEKIKMLSMWQSIDPDTDPDKFKTIAEKMTGMSRIPLTPSEKQLMNRVNMEISRREKELFEAQVEKLKAEAEYARGGKQGSLQSLLNRNVITNSTDELLKGIGDTYVRLPNGEVKAEKNLTQMEQLLNKKAPRLSPEEAKAETDKRIRAVQDALQQQENERRAIENPQQIPENLQKVLEYGRKEKYTNEQLEVLLRANGATPSQIQQLINQGATLVKPTSTPSAKSTPQVMEGRSLKIEGLTPSGRPVQPKKK